ncbi:MAG: FtsX-like permease family protein [Saprospiraceae bacterium]
MFEKNLKLAFRNLLRNKSQSAILIGGLTAGMTACILLLLYVKFELSFDEFHAKKENIYRVVNQRFQNGKSVQKGTITYPTIGPTMMAEFPEIKNSTRIGYSSDMMLVQGERVNPLGTGLWVDEHFFEIFDFPILTSEGLNILDEPNEVVLPRRIAEQYFPMAKGNYERLIGEELKIERYPEAFKIVAVCEDAPANSLLEFDLLCSYASSIRYWGEGADNSWTWSDFYHYLELAPGTDVAALEAKFASFSERHFHGAEVSGSEEVFTLQPLSQAHLYSSDLEYEIGRTANGQAVWALLAIAFFILVIAWVNYVNLSSARAIERAKEVGVRKVIGARRSQLIWQFLTEALTINTTSLILAFGLVQILRPWFAYNFGLEASALSFLGGADSNMYLLLTLLALIAAGVAVSGAYPAWMLSSPHVSSVLKGIFTKDIGGAGIRKGLVIFQFTLSIALITATWFVSRQIHFMTQQDLGINVDRVLSINSPEMTNWDSTFIGRMDAFKAELTNHPEIISASTSDRAPGERMSRAFQIKKVSDGESGKTYSSNTLQTDFGYAETYGLQPVAGRFFRQNDHNSDVRFLDKIVVNEAAVRMFGFANSEAAIGQQLEVYGTKLNIIGVLPDFHQQSLHHAIEPIIFAPFYGNGNQLSLKVSDRNLDQTLAYIQTTYKSFFPGNAFQYSFVDDRFQRLYESDIRFSHILSFFTLLTILIACLGLFGLVSYMTFLRTKEIGVRKVLGASSASIVALLSKDFLKLVFFSLIIGAPLAWFAISKYLRDFAYHINMDWWVFVLTGLVAVGVAFLTVSFQSIKAAIANPVESLRSE